MQDRKRIYGKLVLAVSSLSTLFVLTEIIMKSFGKSICHTEGCKVVAQHVRYGDISILDIGLVTFFLLALFTYLSQYRGKAGLERFINFILIVSLACEGFFTGYQAFSIHTPCVFCLIILGLIILIALMRLLSGEHAMLTGFATLVAVFSMFSLVLPAEVAVNLPESERLILFYSPECKHCAAIMKELEANKISVRHLDVKEYGGFLKNVGIDRIPTLLVNDTFQKTFFTGENAIRSYLITCSQAAKTGLEKPKAKAPKASAPKKGQAGSAINMLNQQGLLNEVGQPAADDGMCKENVICK